MTDKTIKQFETCHNRMGRLLNLLFSIKEDELTENELKKFKKLKKDAGDLAVNFGDFKLKAFKERGIEIS